jgi:acyl-CoA synthetase (NDP forming)
MIAPAIPVIYTAAKPIAVALMGERLIQEAVEHFRAAHVPEYRFPERAAAALAVLVERAEYLGRQTTHAESFSTQIETSNNQVVRTLLEAKPAGSWLPQDDAQRIISL